MLGRKVIVDTLDQTVNAAQDLLEIKLGTGQAGYVAGFKVVQNTLEGVTAIPKSKLNLKRASGSFTSGSGGGAATVTKGQTGDPAHGLATSERNNTTQAVAGSGTLEVIDPDLFNESGGISEVTYTPEMMPAIGPSEAAILALDEAPSASCTMRAIVTLIITHG